MSATVLTEEAVADLICFDPVLVPEQRRLRCEGKPHAFNVQHIEYEGQPCYYFVDVLNWFMRPEGFAGATIKDFKSRDQRRTLSKWRSRYVCR